MNDSALNTQVAERLGWTNFINRDARICGHPPKATHLLRSLPDWCNDLATAIGLLDGQDWDLRGAPGGPYNCTIWAIGPSNGTFSAWETVHRQAESLPHAIVLAWLAATAVKAGAQVQRWPVSGTQNPS